MTSHVFHLPTLTSDVNNGQSLLIKYFLQQNQCDAKISSNTKLIDRIIECRDLDECACLKLGGTYTFILGKCYFVEINQFNYTDAMVNCQIQFGSKHTGKLFEPRDLATNDEVIDYAQGLRNNRFWLGINDIDIEGTFQYATGGNLVFTNWEAGQPDNYAGAQDCVLNRGDIGILENWDDFNCNTKYFSICEMI